MPSKERCADDDACAELAAADSLVALFNKIRASPRDGAAMGEAEENDDEYEYGLDEYEF